MGNAGFRKALVVVQFVFSVALIISTLIIGLQLKYVREKGLGFDKEHIFSFDMRQELVEHYAAARQQLLKNRAVSGVASSMAPIIGESATTGDTDWEGKPAGSLGSVLMKKESECLASSLLNRASYLLFSC